MANLTAATRRKHATKASRTQPFLANLIKGMVSLWWCLASTSSSSSSSMVVEARLGLDDRAITTTTAASRHNSGNRNKQQQQPPRSAISLLQRQLVETLSFLGREPEVEHLPLPLCAGDCDNDRECAEGLICYKRSAGDRVPGCHSEGRVVDNSPTDYCVLPESVVEDDDELGEDEWIWADGTTTTGEPTSSPIAVTPMTAAPTFPKETLDPNAPTPTPHTILPTFEFRGPPTSLAPTSETWAVLMNNSDPVPLIYVGNNGEFEAPYPLGPCQSDCDRDADCYGELVCFQRDGGEAVPGCLGEDVGRSDYCVFPEHLQNTTDEEVLLWQSGFQLKVYWEEGYQWQNETIERKWCITRDYEGSPVTGKCWYGDLSLPCNSSETYTSRCSDPEDPDPKQLFDFVPVSNDEVLIQAYNEDRCFHRFKRNITMETCNATNHRQRWFTPRGGFNEEKFELSQKRIPKWCLNQDHHPKYGEVMRMFECEKIRSPSHETSWFNLY